jgi:small subunit ribosomal protein S15
MFSLQANFVRGTQVSSSAAVRTKQTKRTQQTQIVCKDQNTRPSLDAVAEFKINANDTGSASLQIALLTKRIENLTAHLQANRKDKSTQRGLKLLLGKRGRLQTYLAKEDPARYQMTLKGLGLKIKST